jgi:large repetitive protein
MLSIGKDVATLSLMSSANPSAQGSWVTFTATVSASSGTGSAPTSTQTRASAQAMAAQGTGSVQGFIAAATGTVSFTDGGTSLGTVSLVNGAATFATPFTTPGARAIKASYSGDAATAAASITITQSVGAADPMVPAPALSNWMLALLGGLMTCVALVRMSLTRARGSA